MVKQYGAAWERKKLIADLARERKWQRVLDFGAGNGAYVPELLKYSQEVVCLENDQRRIKQLKKNFSQNSRVKLLFFQDKSLPFPAKSFDLVWASEVLEHQRDFSLVKEWERIAKNLIVITLPNPFGPYWRIDKTHILSYSLSSLKKLFNQRENFSYQIHGLGFCWPPRFGMISLRKIFLKLTWNHPKFAWSWLILGKRKKWSFKE